MQNKTLKKKKEKKKKKKLHNPLHFDHIKNIKHNVFIC